MVSAPKSVIEKHHGEEIQQELESRLFQNTFQEAVKQNEDLDILNVKTPQDVTHAADGAFSFNAELILAPTVELPEYKGIEIEVPKLEVTDEQVGESLEQLRQRFADYEDITDRAAEKGDLAVIDYTATSDGKPLDEIAGEQAKPLASNEGYWIRIEDEAFFPGFTEELIGTKSGDEKEITVTLPVDFPLEELRDKEATFAVQVKELKAETLP
ncbi:trigger factor, partial [Akkermansiaceae bacterium]|nr:trigger factor [Akkermansiaceae bacterium]